VDHRTDVYSLGATLYELLALEPVFVGNDRQELLRQIAFEEPKPPRRVSKAIPAELETIVLKAMEKNPAERYATAKELADDLRRFLADEPIRARRAGVVRRLRKWSRRHRTVTAAAMAAATAAVVVLSSGIGWVANDRATRREAMEREVVAAWKESLSWQGQGRLPEALSAARRASGLAAEGSASRELRERARRRQADLELVLRLDQIPLEKAVVARHGPFDYELADRRYGEEFRAAGIAVDELTAEGAAGRLRGTSVAVALAAALDCWALDRQRYVVKKEESWKHLLNVARLADPDASRCRLRDAVAAGDNQALIDLAKAEDLSALEPSALVLLGNALRRPDAFEETVQLLRRAQRLHPADFWINYNLANALEVGTRETLSQRAEEGVRFATVAVALRPESPGAVLLLARLLAQGGRAEEADAYFREALRLQPRYVTIYNNRGSAFFQQGRLDDAIASFREVVRLRRLNQEAVLGVELSNLGVALLWRGDLDEAITSFREAAQLEPAYGGWHRSLAQALSAKGRLDEALEEYREAVRLGPNDAEAQILLAWFLATCPDRRLREPQEAVAHAERGVALAPASPASWGSLGAARYRAGDWKGAVEALTRSSGLRGVGPALFFLAMAHWRLGEEGEARRIYDQAVALLAKQKRPQENRYRAYFYEEWLRFRAEAAELLGVGE
jgi:tetratricopeptide (TPR) repeat protein